MMASFMRLYLGYGVEKFARGRSTALEFRATLIDEGIDALADVFGAEQFAEQRCLEAMAVGGRHCQSEVDRALDLRHSQRRARGDLIDQGQCRGQALSGRH